MAKKTILYKQDSSYLMSSVKRKSTSSLVFPLLFIRSVAPERLMVIYPVSWVVAVLAPSYMIGRGEKRVATDL